MCTSLSNGESPFVRVPVMDPGKGCGVGQKIILRLVSLRHL